MSFENLKKESETNYFHWYKLFIVELKKKKKKKHFMNKNMVALQRNHEKHMEMNIKLNVSKIIAGLSFI